MYGLWTVIWKKIPQLYNVQECDYVFVCWQLTVSNKNLRVGSGKSRTRIHNFQFRIKDSSVEYFYPGSKG